MEGGHRPDGKDEEEVERGYNAQKGGQVCSRVPGD